MNGMHNNEFSISRWQCVGATYKPHTHNVDVRCSEMQFRYAKMHFHRNEKQFIRNGKYVELNVDFPQTE